MRLRAFGLGLLAAILLAAGNGAFLHAQSNDNTNNMSSSQMVLKVHPPKEIPVFSTYNLGRQGFYYAISRHRESGDL